MNKLSFNHTVTNNSNYFVLVGNCKDYISHHNTLDDALTALDKINVADSKWAIITVLEPNETKTVNNLEKTLYEQPKNINEDDLFNLLTGKETEIKDNDKMSKIRIKLKNEILEFYKPIYLEGKLISEGYIPDWIMENMESLIDHGMKLLEKFPDEPLRKIAFEVIDSCH